CGAISAAANSRTTDRNCSCSGDASKSTESDATRATTVRLVEARAILRDGDEWIVCTDPVEVVVASGEDAFAELDRMANAGFWVGFCSYDLGRAIEHIDTSTDDDLALPDVAFVRYGTVARLTAPPVALTSIELGPGTSTLSRAEHAARV